MVHTEDRPPVRTRPRSDHSEAHYGRREFLRRSVTAAAGAGCLGFWPAAQSWGRGKVCFEDEAATHNMLMIGQQTVFLSHWPMFHNQNGTRTPHRYQVLLEATIAKAGQDLTAMYANDRRDHPGTKIYTLNPEPEFVLPQLNSETGPRLTHFTANIVRGHIERPGPRVLARAAVVTVKKVIHFHEFDPMAAALPRLEYILFGKSKELFMAHLITRPPDFDQVLAVSIDDHGFSDEALSKGVRIVFDQANSISERLTEGKRADGKPVEEATSSKVLKVKVDREFYLEEGELKKDADFDPTSLETAAGFP
jgi:hypothetical protein